MMSKWNTRDNTKYQSKALPRNATKIKNPSEEHTSFSPPKELKPKVLGFVLLNRNTETGEPFFVSETVQELFNLHSEKLPILDRQKLLQFNHEDFHKFSYTGSTCHYQPKPPVTKFLEYMGNTGKEIFSKDTLIISTNRKVLLNILSKFQKDVTLGVHGALKVVLKCTDKISRDVVQHSLGYKFEAYLLQERSEDNSNMRLFSIHSIQIRDKVILYNCEVDALDWDENLGTYFPVEIKTCNDSKASNLANYVGNPCTEWNMQARLGQIQKMIIGLHSKISDGESGNTKDSVNSLYELPVEDRQLLKAEIYLLNTLVRAVEESGISPGNPLSEWEDWIVKKDGWPMV